MRVDRVVLSADDEDFFSFSLGEVPTSDKYHVKQIFGLDADGIVRKFNGYGKTSGKRRYEYSYPDRVLTFRAKLNPNFAINESYSEIRDEMYRAIAANANGTITISFRKGGVLFAQAQGHITKFEAPYTSAEPEIQITIECEKGIFKAPSPIIIDVNDWLSLPDPGSTITFADNLSTAPHGLRMNVHFTSFTTSFKVADSSINPEWEFEIIPPNGGFDEDEKLFISSEFNDQQVLYGAVSALEPNQPKMDWVVPGSVWPIIFPKSNTLYIQGWPFDFFKFTIEYYPSYWGL